jgi:hypothetical protein
VDVGPLGAELNKRRNSEEASGFDGRPEAKKEALITSVSSAEFLAVSALDMLDLLHQSLGTITKVTPQFLYQGISADKVIDLPTGDGRNLR